MNLKKMKLTINVRMLLQILKQMYHQLTRFLLINYQQKQIRFIFHHRKTCKHKKLLGT